MEQPGNAKCRDVRCTSVIERRAEVKPAISNPQIIRWTAMPMRPIVIRAAGRSHCLQLVPDSAMAVDRCIGKRPACERIVALLTREARAWTPAVLWISQACHSGAMAKLHRTARAIAGPRAFNGLCEDEGMPLICPTCQVLMAQSGPSRQLTGTLHGVVFDILLGEPPRRGGGCGNPA